MGTSKAALLTLVSIGWLAAVLAMDEGCGGCWLVYDPAGIATLPAGTPDCTVTFLGASGIAVFDCPAPGSYAGPGCTAPAALNVVGVDRLLEGEGSAISISVGDNHGVAYASNLKGWLGGSDFTVVVQCGGTLMTALRDQSISQYCPE